MRKSNGLNDVSLPFLQQAGLELSQAIDEACPEAVEIEAQGPEGHRARMRERLLSAGAEALLDHEMLEMLLFLALPRRDTKPVARALLARFGSFAEAIAAPAVELRGVAGLGEAGVAALKLAQGSALRLLKAEIAAGPVLDSRDKLVAYLTAALAREREEQLRVLFLDTRQRLIADQEMARGTVNHTPVYPREIIRRALELRASGMILVHNHPSGDPRPSQADVEMTNEIRTAATLMDIALHDHLVIGRGAHFSFRRQGLL